ncbi:C4-type zinc ribbon domain-containing protein [Desulfuromonas sp. AOP6]|uniref:zinc ribbon domain-containing protein n=1 Tax=Desulfuromonas sp. AOP6 TaxID=1566351 RepID=UPI00126C82A6|nr:C4-type zinc ribbon domain-containing protein [Desulfuromonas sp. AOP6]BCA78610.1 hypothetical protein AOP6_0397 [Desulfuromonas sp. AOP6]
MQEKMEKLKDLQELDQELIGIRHKRQVLADEQQVSGEELARIQAMVDKLDGDIDALKKERAALQQALAQEQDNVQKAEGRLPAIKTQKEYVAVLKEVDTAKKMNKELLDSIQRKDAEIDVLARDQEEKTEELGSLQEKTSARNAEIDAAMAEFDGVLQEKGVQREALLKGLSTTVRKRYQMLLERRGGIAVVEARNETCLGCNMHLPPQLFNNLYTAAEIQSCPHCNRLLYVLPR